MNQLRNCVLANFSCQQKQSTTMLSRLCKRTSQVVSRSLRKKNTSLPLLLVRHNQTRTRSDEQKPTAKPDPIGAILHYRKIYELLGKLDTNGIILGSLATEEGLLRIENFRTEEELQKAKKEIRNNSQHESIREAIKKAYDWKEFAYHIGYHFLPFDQLHIRSDSGEWVNCGSTLNPTKKDVETIKQLASPAAYGDLLTMSTNVDPHVRSGWEVPYDKLAFTPNWRIDPTEKFFTDSIKSAHRRLEGLVCEVQKTLDDSSLYLEPYKLNLYEKGGRFIPHKDTPIYPNMIGTLVITLHKAYKGGGLLVVYNGDEIFREDTFQTCPITAFYCDRPHEITPITNGWHRLSLTFNICKDDRSVPKSKNAIMYKHGSTDHEVSGVAALIKAIKGSNLQKVGIITEYDYTQKGLSRNHLKGKDKIIFEELAKEPSFKVAVVPVAVSQHYADNTSEDVFPCTYNIRGQVFRFEEEDIKQMMKGEPLKKLDDVLFFRGRDGLEVHRNHQKGAMYVGNQCLEDQIENIYFNAAIIITNNSAKP